MAGSGNTALGDWVASTFASPTTTAGKAMASPNDPNRALTPEEEAAKKKKLLAAGQGETFGSTLMSILGSHY